jgi:hypothetical protein
MAPPLVTEMAREIEPCAEIPHDRRKGDACGRPTARAHKKGETRGAAGADAPEDGLRWLSVRDAAAALGLTVEPPVRSSSRRLSLAVAVTIGVLGAAFPAAASLGGDAASVVRDRAHLQARLSTQLAGARTLHVMTLANGAERRELARADGTVFAITWQGRSPPDLRQLMGPAFSSYNTALGQTRARRSRRPVDVRQSDLVVHAAGHGGAFWGYAYLPSLAPDDFSLGELKAGLPS